MCATCDLLACLKQLPRTEALPTPNAGTDQQHVGTDSIGNVSPSKPAGTTVEASTLLVMKKKKKKVGHPLAKCISADAWLLTDDLLSIISHTQLSTKLE